MGYLSDRLSPNSVWAQALNRPLSGAQRMALENRLGPMQQNMLPQQNMAPQTPQDDILLAAALGMHNRPPSGPERRMTADDPRPGVLPQPTLVPATDEPLADRMGTFLAQYLPENTLVPQLPWDALANEQRGTTPDPKPTAEIVSNLVAMAPGMSLDEIQYGNSGGMDVFNTALGVADVLGVGALAKPFVRAGVNVAEDVINNPSVARFLADERGSLGRAGGVADALSGAADDAARVADDVPGITAYHGSPHTFDQFRWDDTTRGTGEGAQAYGDGLYFAEAEDVALGYQTALTKPHEGGLLIGGESQLAPPGGGTVRDELVRRLSKEFGLFETDNVGLKLRDYPDLVAEELDNMELKYGWDSDALALINRARSEGIDFSPNGSMYQVRLNANPEDFLDFDVPLAQQSEKVRSALSQFRLTGEITDGMPLGANGRLRVVQDPDLPEYRKYFMVLDSGQEFRLTDKDLTNFIAMSNDEVAGRNILSTLATQYGTENAAATVLREAGIPGIKYLDGGSRAAGVGSRNYVVFNDSIIEILKRYGLLAPAGAGLGLAATNNEAEASQ